MPCLLLTYLHWNILFSIQYIRNVKFIFCCLYEALYCLFRCTSSLKTVKKIYFRLHNLRSDLNSFYTCFQFYTPVKIDVPTNQEKPIDMMSFKYNNQRINYYGEKISVRELRCWNRQIMNELLFLFGGNCVWKTNILNSLVT